MNTPPQPIPPIKSPGLIAFFKEKLATTYAKILVGIAIGFIILVLIGLYSSRIERSNRREVVVLPTPTYVPTDMPTPTDLPMISTVPISQTLVATKAVPTILPTTAEAVLPTATYAPVATATPTPQPPDTTAPVIKEMTGPADGSTVNFNNFCFPVNVVDDRSKYPNIFTQYQFDSSDWTSWGNDVSPCFSSVSNGVHTYSFHVKDEAGNVSATITRTFTVQM